MSRPDYTKWALGCLFREIRKENSFPNGDLDIVSRWAVEAVDMGSKIPTKNNHVAAHWIGLFFLPDWRSYGLPETPIILEIKRRLAEYNHAKETH